MTTATSRLCMILLGGMAASAATASDTLYLHLGGGPGVTAIANALIDRAAADPVTGPGFKDSKLDRIKRLLAEQICDLSGGPCHYSGDSMHDVHAGHQISEAQFYRMVEELREVLKERHVDTRSTNQLLRLLAPMKRDIVEHRAPAHGTLPSPASANPPASTNPPSAADPPPRTVHP